MVTELILDLLRVKNPLIPTMLYKRNFQDCIVNIFTCVIVLGLIL